MDEALPAPLAGVATAKPITLLPDTPAAAERATSAAESDADVAWRVRLLGSRNDMIVSGTTDQRLATVARLQRGRASRTQLHSVGLTNAAIQRRVRRGTLLREHPSVYIVGHAAPVPLGPETGALLWAPEGAVLSHHSAAALWAVGGADRNVHILVQGGHAGRRPGVTIHRTRLLDARDIHIRDGLAVTAPARTLLDCAAATTPYSLERMFTEALVLRLVTPAEIEDVLARFPGATGAGQLRALVDAEDEPGRLRSDSEKRMRALIRKAGLPPPLVNVTLHGFEVDLYWPAHQLVVEVDSYGFHTPRWAYERDCRKDAVLRSHGMPPMRFSRRQILDEPLVVVAQIAGGLAAGGGRPPSTPTPAGREATAR